MTRVFLDTAFSVALVIERDAYHARAVDLAAEIKRDRAQVTTTVPVLLEIGNYLSSLSDRQVGSVVIEQLRNSQFVDVVALDDGLFGEGLSLFKSREDKAWSLTDCISFVVMRQMEIGTALTTDKHFEQAGFEILLK